MPTSESRLSYPDCQTFLDAAIADAKGVRRPFGSYGAAFQFRTRCHTFRKLCRIDNRKIYPDPQAPLHGRSEYDCITIRDPIKDSEGDWWVYAERLDVGEEEIESLSEIGDAT